MDGSVTARTLVDYARYSSPEAPDALERLVSTSGGCKKHYGKALTPAERVLMHEGVSAEAKARVRRVDA